MIEIITISYVVLSLVATVVVIRSEHLERSQQIFQNCVVWLVPFVGAVAILVFHSVVYTNMNSKTKPYRSSNNSNESAADDLYRDLN